MSLNGRELLRGRQGKDGIPPRYTISKTTTTKKKKKKKKKEKRKGKPSRKQGRHDQKLTRAKSLFRDRKRSCYLTFFKVAMSFDNRRGCSKASAT